MIMYIALGVLILLALVLLNFEHHTRKIKIAIMVLLALLIYFSVVGVLNSDNVSLDSPKGVVGAVYYYFGWLGETFSNLWEIGGDTATAVGHVVKFNQTEYDDGRR